MMGTNTFRVARPDGQGPDAQGTSFTAACVICPKLNSIICAAGIYQKQM